MTSQTIGMFTVCSTSCSSEKQRSHQSSALLVFCKGGHRQLADSPHNTALIRKVCSCHYAATPTIYALPDAWAFRLQTGTRPLGHHRQQSQLYTSRNRCRGQERQHRLHTWWVLKYEKICMKHRDKNTTELWIAILHTLKTRVDIEYVSIEL